MEMREADCFLGWLLFLNFRCAQGNKDCNFQIEKGRNSVRFVRFFSISEDTLIHKNRLFIGNEKLQMSENVI